MADHEGICAVALGYNWCTCIAYAEEQVVRGFALYLERSGQVPCPGGIRHGWPQDTPCPWCKAVV